jgi:hypothetical protein
MTLPGLAVNAIRLMGIVENQLIFAREWSPDTQQLLRSIDPGVGWLLVLAAWIYLYFAVMPKIGRVADS